MCWSCHHIHLLYVYGMSPPLTVADLNKGPFELIKLNAQLAGKMTREANPSDRPSPINDLRTGAFKTAQQLVRDRGIRGLYCGYRLHLGKF
jgi:hypothetical protein